MSSASHVMYHGIAALRAALPRSITLAKGEAPPLPFDPSLTGTLSPLHPDRRSGHV